MARIGIGAIGCGGMGSSTLGKVAGHSPDLRVEGLYDPDPASIRKTVDMLGYEPHVCGSVRDLVASPGIRWVTRTRGRTFSRSAAMTSIW